MPKLIISDIVKVPVKFEVNDAGRKVTQSLMLVCDRLAQAEVDAIINDPAANWSDTLRRVVTGWEGQRVVVEEDGAPSAFSAEALEVLMTIPGLSMLAVKAYAANVGATAKN